MPFNKRVLSDGLIAALSQPADPGDQVALDAVTAVGKSMADAIAKEPTVQVLRNEEKIKLLEVQIQELSQKVENLQQFVESIDSSVETLTNIVDSIPGV
jgi:TolA-binding protein